MYVWNYITLKCNLLISITVCLSCVYNVHSADLVFSEI